MFKLVIQDDEGKTTVVPLIRDEITIGRKEGNTIRLTERNVSRRHARILRNNGEVHIEDLGSYNGIRVNNARIAERVSLRVSDQVQIGDYKLYLKAEGLEQVDEAHTLPVERQSQVPTTEAMSAVMPAVTAPQPIQLAAGSGLVGNPARTMVSIGDTDPAGRALAAGSAAVSQVAMAPSGYGRLVVLSSNFAGREFDLSRPQMIVGRTDENDIVINHRSISRNHAKLAREVDNGRYTISDLQSSNGVRVNGQDYGKVELRRGDVIDLGHVRLRFVEAGEDFVFARDAIITDVPDATSRRGLLFAVLAAIVVLGAGVAIYTTMRNNSDKPGTDKPGNDVVVPSTGTNGAVVIDGGDSAIAVEDHGSNGAGSVSGSGETAAVQPPVAPPQQPTVKVDDDKNQNTECTRLQAAKDWQGLRNCADKLDGLGSKDKAHEYTEMAVRETKNELVARQVEQFLHDRNLKEAQASLGRIGTESVYYVSLHDEFSHAENQTIDQVVRKGQSYAAVHDCASLRTLYKQLATSSTARVVTAVAAIKCTDKAAPEPPIIAQRPPPGPGSSVGSAAIAQPVSTAPKSGCDSINVEDLQAQAQTQFGTGNYSTALSLMTRALGCKQSVLMYRLAATYACAAKDAASARSYFAKVPASNQANIVQRCQLADIDLRGETRPQ